MRPILDPDPRHGFGPSLDSLVPVAGAIPIPCRTAKTEQNAAGTVWYSMHQETQVATVYKIHWANRDDSLVGNGPCRNPTGESSAPTTHHDSVCAMPFQSLAQMNVGHRH